MLIVAHSGSPERFTGSKNKIPDQPHPKNILFCILEIYSNMYKKRNRSQENNIGILIKE